LPEELRVEIRYDSYFKAKAYRLFTQVCVSKHEQKRRGEKLREESDVSDSVQHV
jgi:uncharacterized protein YktA (UPF0223 family)